MKARILDGLPKAKRLDSPTENLIVTIEEAENEIEELRVELERQAGRLAKEIMRRVVGVRGWILMLRYVGCLSFKEIAEALGFSEARCYFLHA